MSRLLERVRDLCEKAGMPAEQAEELALSEVGITAERIDEVAIDYFTRVDDEDRREWVAGTMNWQWLEEIGRPFARTVLLSLYPVSSHVIPSDLTRLEAEFSFEGGRTHTLVLWGAPPHIEALEVWLRRTAKEAIDGGAGGD